MGCGGSKKKPDVNADAKNSLDANNRPSVVMDPRSNRQPGSTDPWEQPHALPSPYPQGKIAVDRLFNDEDNIASEDIPIEKEIVPEQMIGNLVKESQIKR